MSLWWGEQGQTVVMSNIFPYPRMIMIIIKGERVSENGAVLKGVEALL